MNKFNLLAVIFLIAISNISTAMTFTDYSKAPLIDSPWKSASEGMADGYRMAKEAQRVQAEQQQLELQNKILKEQLRIMQKRG